MKRAIAALLILNLLDLICTLWFIHHGLAEEANPVMDRLLREGAVLFGVVKLSLVSLGAWIFWSYKHRPAASVAVGITLTVYSAVLLVHMWGFLHA